VHEPSERALKKTLMGESDLLQSNRLEIGHETLEPVKRAILERNGRISFVRKRKKGGEAQ
jgi:uncharacterized membrane protein YcaP (DUF421 family)